MMNLNSNILLSIKNKQVDVQGIYYNNQRILSVGEGDFSFSSFLATQFGVANNIVATSLDSKEKLQKLYHLDAIRNINNLTDRGAQVFHGVNVCNMATRNRSAPLFASGESFYDVINFNFPHAGFYGFEDNPEVIQRHRKLMKGFFTNAAFMLSPGGLVYISHKCGTPYDDWNLQELANMNGLELLGSTPFRSSDFPGYKNRRGSGSKAGDKFELGKAAIYIFAIRCSVWIENIEEQPLQTQNKDNFLLQTLSNLRSFKEKKIKDGCASSKTPLLQVIAAEVARLETLKLGKKKERKLKSLKLMLKVMHLVVGTPAFAIHRITSLQATSSSKKTVQSWSRFQRLALEALEEAFEEEQIVKPEELGFGAPNEGEGQTWLPEVFAEQDMCDSMKDGCPCEKQGKLQVEEVLEIHVSDDIANGALLESEGEEKEDSFCALVLDTQIPFSTFQDVMEPKYIVPTGHLKSEDSNNMSTIHQDNIYFRLEYQGSDEDQSDMPDLAVFGVSELSPEHMEDMEDTEEGFINYSLADRISKWTNKYIFSCFGN